MATTYPRLVRDNPAYAWWKFPLSGLIGLSVYIGVIMAATFAVIIPLMVIDPTRVEDAMESLESTLELSVTMNPVVFAGLLLSVALMLPAIFVGVLATGPRPVGNLSSVAGRLRWRWLMTALVPALFLAGVLGGLALLTERDALAAPNGRVLVNLAVVLLVIPFQAAAEEYVFRGYVLQLVGSWTKIVWIAVLVNVLLFTAGHGYATWGLVDVAVFGLVASVLTIRTGGLEAAIALHAVNNITLFVLEGFGAIDPTGGSDVTPWAVLPTVIVSLVYFGAIEWLFRRSGLTNVRPSPPPATIPMPVPAG